jgi:(p)ppGpp synthase/HD superfamily hydrolase
VLPGDPVVGYISLGKGITVHHEDCKNVKALRRNPERFTKIPWDGDATSSFRAELHVDGWDCMRLLETSRAHSRSPASTSSRPVARSSTRWSRTTSSSRWETRRR